MAFERHGALAEHIHHKIPDAALLQRESRFSAIAERLCKRAQVACGFGFFQKGIHCAADLRAIRFRAIVPQMNERADSALAQAIEKGKLLAILLLKGISKALRMLCKGTEQAGTADIPFQHIVFKLRGFLQREAD